MYAIERLDKSWRDLTERLYSWRTITAKEAAAGYVEVLVAVPWRWWWLNDQLEYEIEARRILLEEFSEVLRVSRVSPTKKQFRKHGRKFYSYAGVVK